MTTFNYLLSYEVKGLKKTCDDLELALLLYLSRLSVLKGLTFYTSHSIGFQSQESISSLYDYLLANYIDEKDLDASLQFVIIELNESNQKRSFSNVKEINS